MGIIVDTNIFIYLENGKLLDAFLQKNSDEDYFITSVIMSELLTGVEMATSLSQQIKRSAFVEAVISRFPVLDFNSEVARVYSKVWANSLKTLGRGKSNSHDLMIGSTALAFGYSVLTNNPDDYKAILCLLCENV